MIPRGASAPHLFLFMKIIQDLSEMIDEEVSDAEKYAKCALMHKEDDPELSRTFSQLANEELGHVDRLHSQITRIIKAYREEQGEPPAPMMAVYNFLHKRAIDKVASVRTLLS